MPRIRAVGKKRKGGRRVGPQGVPIQLTHRGDGRVLLGVGNHPPPHLHPSDLGHVCGYGLRLLDEHAEREEEEQGGYDREGEDDCHVAIRIAPQMGRGGVQMIECAMILVVLNGIDVGATVRGDGGVGIRGR
jgi:hypothetical protein